MGEKVVPVPQTVVQEVVRQVPKVMVQEVVRQVPKIMVQEVVKQIAAPAPVVVSAPVVQAPIIETFAPAPIMSAPVYETFAPAPIMAAPMIETFASPIVGGAYGASYGAPIVETFGLGGSYGVGATYGAPIVETFGAGFAPTLATAPLVGSISAALPMTTMAAPVGAFGSPLVGTSYGLPPTVL